MAKSGSSDFFTSLRDALAEKDAGAFMRTLRDAVVPEGESSDQSHGLTEQDRYVLQHAPTILAALVVRRSSSDPDKMVEQAIDGVRKIYDVVHELDTPATTMLSQPVENINQVPEQYEIAMRRLKTYVRREENGTFRLDITDPKVIDIAPTVFDNLKLSLEETNKKILSGEIKAGDIKEPYL